METYISIYKKDYIWYTKIKYAILTQSTCKRLSTPKHVSEIKYNKYSTPWKC